MLTRLSAMPLLVILVSACSSGSSLGDDGANQTPLQEGAIGVAIEDYLSEFLSVLPIEKNGVIYDSISVCLKTNETIDLEALTAVFPSKKLVAYSWQDCSKKDSAHSEIQKYDQYVDPQGQEAADLILTSDCHGLRECQVEIEEWFRKDRYTVVRTDGSWTIMRRENLWLRD